MTFAVLAFCRQGEFRARKAVDEFERVSEAQLGADVLRVRASAVAVTARRGT